MFGKIAQLFYILISLPLASSLTDLLRELKDIYPSWQPEAIVDIGANQGHWSEESRDHFPSAKLLLLEATRKHDENLDKITKQLGNAEYQINVLSGRSGDTVQFFEDGNTGNSMFKEDSKHYADAKSSTRTTITLDDAIKISHLKNNDKGVKDYIVDFIKVDVQGAELLALQGGLKTLAEASFVQVESSLTEYNPGGACFYEVDEFFRSQGFYLYEMTEFFRNPSFKTMGIGQFDSLYVRPSSDRLPAQFKELKGTYCGVGRTSSTNMSDDGNYDLLMSFVIQSFVLVCGYVAGRWHQIIREKRLIGGRKK